MLRMLARRGIDLHGSVEMEVAGSGCKKMIIIREEKASIQKRHIQTEL